MSDSKQVTTLEAYRQRKAILERNKKLMTENKRNHPEMVIVEKSFFYTPKEDTMELVVKRRDEVYVVHVCYNHILKSYYSQMWTMEEFVDRTLDEENPDDHKT